MYYAHHDYIYSIITFDSSIVKYYCNLKFSKFSQKVSIKMYKIELIYYLLFNFL